MIDPRIPMMAQAPPTMSLAEMLQAVESIRGMRQNRQHQQQQQRINDLKERELQRGLKRRDAIEDVLRRNKGDIEQSIPEVTQIDPQIGNEWKVSWDRTQREEKERLRKAGLDDFENEIKFNNYVTGQLKSINSMPDLSMRQQAWPLVLRNVNKAGQLLKKDGVNLQDWAQEYDPMFVYTAMALSKTSQQHIDEEKEFRERNKPVVVGSGSTYHDPLSPQTDYTAPKEPQPPGALENYFQQYAREQKIPVDPRTGQAQLTTAQQEAARKRWSQADDSPAAQQMRQADTDTAEEIANAIERGDRPPTLQGLYRHGPLVHGILAKRKFNLTDATLDWQATQNWLRSASSAQQLRMRQAVDNTYHSLQTIQDAAQAWNAGNFPVFNKATIDAAVQANLGKKVQATIAGQEKEWTPSEIATILKAQIADVTAELANVYMGGNSPTEQAMKLASHNLNENWSSRTLQSMIDLTRNNLKIRENSMKNTGPVGSDNRYYTPPSTEDVDKTGLSAVSKAKFDALPDTAWVNEKGEEIHKRIRDASGASLGVYAKRNGQYVRVGN